MPLWQRAQGETVLLVSAAVASHFILRSGHGAAFSFHLCSNETSSPANGETNSRRNQQSPFSTPSTNTATRTNHCRFGCTRGSSPGRIFPLASDERMPPTQSTPEMPNATLMLVTSAL